MGVAVMSVLEGMNVARKYLMRFDVDSNMMAALSSTENEVFVVQHEVKQQ